MICRCLLFTLLGLNSVSALALCQGPENELSGESCATSDVTLSIPALARINELEAFELGVFDYETAPQDTNDFCIWYNTEQFALTVTSENTVGDNTFSLLGSNTTERIPYQVTWFDQTGGSGNELILTDQEDVPQQQLALPQQPADSGCTTRNVSINVTVPLQNLEDKPEDSYSDTLTVTVSIQ